MRLHDHPRSSNAQKVRFLLSVLALEYERRTVPFADERPDWHLAINPVGGIPALIDGDVVLPANGAEYRAAKQVFNSNYDGSTPAAVVTVKSQSDIQKAVVFAGANGVVIAPRGGGHSYTGASTTTKNPSTTRHSA